MTWSYLLNWPKEATLYHWNSPFCTRPQPKRYHAIFALLRIVQRRPEKGPTRAQHPPPCMYTIHYTLYTALCIKNTIFYIAKKLIHTVHCTLYTVHCTLYTVHCTPYTVHCTLYTVHCTLYTVHCTLYTAQYTLQAVKCTVHTSNTGSPGSRSSSLP